MALASPRRGDLSRRTLAFVVGAVAGVAAFRVPPTPVLGGSRAKHLAHGPRRVGASSRKWRLAAVDTLLGGVSADVVDSAVGGLTHAIATTTTAGGLEHVMHNSGALFGNLGQESLPQAAAAAAATAASSSSLLVSFADQGQNLAGILFQASLLPYVIFLYFLSRDAVEAPALVKFGFAYLLLFVGATIPTGLISKGTWGVSLADCDWLHGGAEFLLTVTNVLLVLGFRDGVRGKEASTQSVLLPLVVAGVSFAGVVALITQGIPMLHLEAHSPLLGGVGALPASLLAGAPTEPENALSVPTWAVHFSSVGEFVVAMGLAVKYAARTGNPKWRGLAVAMLPSHASGVCACAYHLFYNDPDLKWLVATQAGLTALGNCCLAVAAYRLATSTGWTWSDVLPGGGSGEDVEKTTAPPPTGSEEALAVQPDAVLFAELLAFAIGGAYLTKYGSLAALDFLTSAPAPAALLLVAGIPVAVGAAVVLDPAAEDSDASPAGSS